MFSKRWSAKVCELIEEYRKANKVEDSYLRKQINRYETEGAGEKLIEAYERFRMRQVEDAEQTTTWGVVHEEQTIGKGAINALWTYWPGHQETEDKRLVIFFHGGAYCYGSPNSYRALAARLSRSCRIRVLSVDYRLAPRYPYPAALEDACIAYQWALQDFGAKPDQIILAGDSAGGGLTCALLLKLQKEQRENIPAGAILMYPWVDLTLQSESNMENGKKCLFQPNNLVLPALYYCGNTPREYEFVSPLFAKDFSSFPPILIEVGNWDILYSDSLALADKLRESGAEVTLNVINECPHGYLSFAKFYPPAILSFTRMGDFVRMLPGFYSLGWDDPSSRL